MESTSTRPVRTKSIILPSVSFSLAAITRRRQVLCQQQGPEQPPQQYVLVHEPLPRGWWLPGGGVEHYDETPVHAAIRETLEEAASPSFADKWGVESFPRMTHLLSLEQTPGRIRFIFRGELIDDTDGNDDATAGTNAILKSYPGDKDSLEAQWMTWDEIQYLAKHERSALHKHRPSGLQNKPTKILNDPWLRGHEPVTFYGMLERSQNGKRSVPWLPVFEKTPNHVLQQDEEEEVIGAFFGRIKSDALHSNEKSPLLTHGGRAATLTHLHSRLIVHDPIQNFFAIDKSTNNFPSSFVENQYGMTLARLANDMIAKFASPFSVYDEKQHGRNPVGLLRVEHFIHDNGKEATLTVFPCVRLSSKAVGANELDWVPLENLKDSLESRLAKSFADCDTKVVCSLDVLRDSEGPRS